MFNGFIRVAAATPKIRVADPAYNAEQVIRLMKEGEKLQVKLMVFPELCLTGYTCQDLFLQFPLIRRAKEALAAVIEASKDVDMLIFVGLREASGNYTQKTSSELFRVLRNAPFLPGR